MLIGFDALEYLGKVDGLMRRNTVFLLFAVLISSCDTALEDRRVSHLEAGPVSYLEGAYYPLCQTSRSQISIERLEARPVYRTRYSDPVVIDDVVNWLHGEGFHFNETRSLESLDGRLSLKIHYHSGDVVQYFSDIIWICEVSSSQCARLREQDRQLIDELFGEGGCRDPDLEEVFE